MEETAPGRNERESYESENVELCVGGARAVCWLWIAVVPPFLLVDLARFPDRTWELLEIRLAFLVAGIACLAALRTRWGSARPRLLILLLGTLGGLSVYAQMGDTGGHTSPYFAGIGLIMLGTSLLMPWAPFWTWLLCGELIALYFLYALFLEPIGDGRMFANNLFSYVATAMIAGVATIGRERLRRREFTSRFALIRSEARLRVEAETSNALAHAGQELIASLETPRILDRLCHITAAVLPCEVSHAILWDEDRRVWRAVAHYGDTPEAWSALSRIEVGSEEAAPVFKTLEQDGILRLGTSNESPAGSAARQAGIHTSLWVPLRRGSRIVGVLTAGLRDRSRAMTARHERMLTGIAQLASMALANAKLHDELSKRAETEARARTAAEAANRAKDQFLATLSHELRTPLNIILGFSEIAADEDLGSSDRRDAVGRIDRAGRQLSEMIDDILELTRLKSGSVELVTEEVRLDELCHDLEERCSQLPNPNGISLRWSCDAPDVVIATDRRKLAVILRNLVGNGLKFTEHGSVEVQIDLDADGVRFRVADTGIGIPASAHDEVFEPFRQLDSSNARPHGGLGLGLDIVRQCAEHLGGTVDLDSEPGHGATFTVGLPGACVVLHDGGDPPAPLRPKAPTSAGVSPSPADCNRN